VLDDAGKQTGMVLLPVDLLRLNQQIFGTLPPHIPVAVVDGENRVALRSVDPEKSLGKLAPVRTQVNDSGQTDRLWESTGFNGERWLFALVTVPKTNWTVRAGVREDLVLAETDATLVRGVWMRLGILLLALLLAWWIARGIVRPIDSLSATVDKQVEGESGVRVPQLHGPVQIEGLLRNFNRMLDARDRSEARLREGEQNLFITLQSIGDAVIATDPQGHITRMNPTAERMTGWSLVAAAGLPLTDVFRIISSETRLPALNPVQLVMARGEVVGLSNHTVLCSRDGKEYQISDSAAPIRDAAGQIVGVVLVFSDVTEQYLAQEKARQSEEFVRVVADNIPGMVGYWSRDLHCIFANQEYFTWFGRTPQQAHGMHMKDLLGDTLLAQNEPYIHAVLTGQDQQFERAMRKVSGEERTTWVHYIPHRIQAEVVGFFVLVTDITPLKKAEAQALESRNVYRLMMNSLPDTSVYLFDRDFRYLALGGHEYERHNFDKSLILGKTLSEAYPPAIVDVFDPLFNRAVQGEIFSVELPYGADTYLHHLQPLRNDAGEIFGAMGISTNITARKQAELVQQALLKEKTALLNEVHHRVKNNLQVISSVLRLEARRSKHAPTQAVLTDMQDRIRSMALLHESIYRAGTFAAIDLGRYIQTIASQAFHSQRDVSQRITLRLELGSVQVGLDQATPCGLLVTELISNTLKHAFPGDCTGEVCIALQPVGNDGQWCLRVSDTGVGMPADFDLRRQSSLGLQLVDGLALQLDAEVQIGPGSGPGSGSGSTFAVSFAVIPV
jgi:PAS domain S-box-containing protein